MRKLTTPDIFQGIRLIKALGLREDARELAQKADTMDDVWSMGYDFIWGLFDKLTEQGGEDSLYAFLSKPFEMTIDEIKALPFADFVSLVKQLTEENDLLNFFKNAVAMMK